MHPLEQGADLIQCQGGREAARQIHMDFIRTTRGIGAQFADPAQAVTLIQDKGYPRKPPLALLQSPPSTFMVSCGLLARTGKGEPINREGEARIHGIYRTPVRSAVGSAPVLPRRGPFRSAPQPIGMRRGPALPPDGVTDSTLLQRPSCVGRTSFCRTTPKAFSPTSLATILIASVLPSMTMLIKTAPAHIFGHGRALLGAHFSMSFALLFGDFELKRFGFCFI
jgi:hypothetical protein